MIILFIYFENTMKNKPFYLYIGYQLISFGFEYYILRIQC